ncbi:hypothetical protein PAMA_012246 [Pampus argenteus]
MCGMCPSCVFAPKPPGSTQCLWRVSDEFKRRFVLELLLRCKSVQVLEHVQYVLGVTSWTFFTYARSRSPTSPQDFPCRGSHRALGGKPLGIDMNEIWDWFSISPDWIKTRYLCRLFLLCESELLRMVANLTSVLLVRLKRRFLQFNVSSHDTSQHHQVSEGDSDDPALMVVPGSSKSVSGRYRAIRLVDPTYANIVEVPVPVKDQERGDIYSGVEKGKPFEAAYANVETKTVRMEERNIYCGTYFTTVMLNMCWSLKTDRCVMVLYGHTSTVNCLDVHADRLVSGAKDCTVKVWSLHTGKHFENVNFKHPSAVQCVKIKTTRVYSSCDRGLIKIWDMENAALLRVINAHRSSVKCLFFDKWHLLSGDCNGQVMAWSIDCDAKECLMTYSHPKEVKSLTLTYLRVVTGCADGKIRIFNFLTGDCLRDITAEAETGRILSLHFLDNSILVNTTSSVKLYHFAKVFWDYTESLKGGQGDVVAQGGSVSEKTAASPRKLPYTSVGVDHAAQVASPTRTMHSCKGKKPERAELLYHTRFLSTHTQCRAQVRERCESSKKSVTLSEKATCDRIKKRGLHHPLTRDFILLRVNAIQRAQCTDEVSMNMECNDKLRDSWGPHSPQDPLHSDLQNPKPRSALKQSLQTLSHPLHHAHGGHHRRANTCIPRLKRTTNLNMTHNTLQGRDVSTAPDVTARRHPCLFPEKLQKAIKRVGATEEPQSPEHILMRPLLNEECCMKTSTSLPRISPVDPIREQGGFRLLTVTQLEDCVRAKRDVMQSSEKDKKIL